MTEGLGFDSVVLAASSEGGRAGGGEPVELLATTADGALYRTSANVSRDGAWSWQPWEKWFEASPGTRAVSAVRSPSGDLEVWLLSKDGGLRQRWHDKASPAERWTDWKITRAPSAEFQNASVLAMSASQAEKLHIFLQTDTAVHDAYHRGGDAGFAGPWQLNAFLDPLRSRLATPVAAPEPQPVVAIFGHDRNLDGAPETIAALGLYSPWRANHPELSACRWQSLGRPEVGFAASREFGIAAIWDTPVTFLFAMGQDEKVYYAGASDLDHALPWLPLGAPSGIRLKRQQQLVAGITLAQLDDVTVYATSEAGHLWARTYHGFASVWGEWFQPGGAAAPKLKGTPAYLSARGHQVTAVFCTGEDGTVRYWRPDAGTWHAVPV